MRSLGMFVGHIAKAIRADVAKPASESAARSTRQEVRRTTEERVVDASELRGDSVGGPTDRSVILRRTVIDEIELREGDDPRAKRGNNHGSGESGGDSPR